MRTNRNLLIKKLDEKLVPFVQAQAVLVPERGWIHTMRTTLNMTLAQLGERLNITRQGAKKIEDNEARGSISLNSLQEAAEAMDLKLVYALVPKDGTLDNLIRLKAEQLAQKITTRANQHMQLENQGVAEESLAYNTKQLADELHREVRKSLWD